MLYIYDDAIVDDLNKSFNPDNMPNPQVKVVGPESILTLQAQMKEDNIQYPVVALNRAGNMSIDSNRTNFTQIHRGIPASIDHNKNEIYHEKILPINLSYSLTILTTNIADRDEIVREILFKYYDMYFLHAELPYEVKRSIRFGIIKDPNADIDYSSSTVEYLQNGQLYQTIIPLMCEGCVMVTYTPMHLKRTYPVVAVRAKGQSEHAIGAKLY